jgi:hypothetical protein
MLPCVLFYESDSMNGISIAYTELIKKINPVYGEGNIVQVSNVHTLAVLPYMHVTLMLR